MRALTQTGTVLALLLFTGACGTETRPPESVQDPLPRAEGDEHKGPDGCTLNQDCTLVPTGCCAACEPTVKDVRAVASAAPRDACQAACGPCPEPSATTVHAQLRAACVASTCTVVDLRVEDSTACEQDDDCELRSRNCCNGCGAFPALWLALRKGATDSTASECMPIPPCAPCADPATPVAYCAADKHCAVRAPD